MLPTTIELSSQPMVGIEEEEQVLMDKILGGTDQLSVVAIVGVPGLGKTTLAKKLYTHENIVNRFDVRSWCCVSQIYDKKRLLLELLGYEFGRHVEIERSEDELILQVQRCLEKKRYLVVIDDVWSTAIWDDLVSCFPDNNKKSRIIITTRLDHQLLSSSVKMFCYTHHLSFLAKDKSWLLLQKTVFKEEFGCHQELEEIGKKIAKSCAGLPLAVILIGNLLARLDKKRGYWTKVAKRLIASAKVAGEGEWYMDIIELNYKNLPHYLKPCFLYFGLFLEDEEVSVKKLIRMWVAEGFVQSNGVKIAEFVAMDYLIDLIASNLVMVAQRFPLGGIKSVRLHDLVLDFCLSKAKEENFLLKVDRSLALDPATSSSASDLQRFFVCCKMQHFIKWLHPTQHIHTFRLYPHSNEMNKFIPSGAFSSDLFKSSLTVLDLENVVIEASALEDITSLIRLRYLAVFGNFSEIPPAILNLINLETLAARPKSGTLTLPGSMWDMINLKHVDISEGEVHFNGVGAEKEDVIELEKLESFSKVVLVNEDDISEMCNRAPNLVQLELMTMEHWGSLFSSLMYLIYLETLAIYHRSEFPMSGISMIFPQSLKELTLSCCGFSWDEISRIGSLPNLEVLNLLLSAFTGRKWTVGVGGFVNVRFLKIEHSSIKHWNMSVDSFPSLEQLVLRWCDKLEEIPSSFGSMPSLQRIEAHSCCPSAAKSAVKSRNMQKDDMKNSDFKLIIYLN
ncbi:PREDICTED: putative late blight resistance protein homolog R1C-3 [Nicotiana attenuata]|uniref:Late blight resistance protein -like r1c-3 n=1 Tax=Nicotiana attenuata TaxID=49451 RepID=A0A1J6KCQ7_NICAT|nr:PREDICTED: putative late blight resistance protein homolog R1C-3 [Nicotiana attenuata]OIT22736.1 putative late blight resistance protein -like r1c-3 [Nicotiana attenuata]